MVVSARVEGRQLPDEPRDVVESSRGEGVEPSRDDHGGVQTNGTGRHCAVPQREHLLTASPRFKYLGGGGPTAEPPGQQDSRGGVPGDVVVPVVQQTGAGVHPLAVLQPDTGPPLVVTSTHRAVHHGVSQPRLGQGRQLAVAVTEGEIEFH